MTNAVRFVRPSDPLRFVQLETSPPNIDYININKNQTDQSAIPKSYKVRVMERLPPETLLGDIEQSEFATKDLAMM